MDVREQLRRYLEQRRELGEQELVLDGMEVDDVLRLMGAMGSGGTGAAGKVVHEVAQPAAPRPASAPARPDERAPAPPPSTTGTADWRAVLRAAGTEPDGAPDERTTGASSDSPPAAISRTSSATTGARETPATPTALAATEGEMARSRKTGDEAPRRGARKTTVSPASHGSGTAQGGAGDGEATAPPRWLAELGLTTGNVVTGDRRLDAPFAGLTSLDEIARATGKCQRCALYRTATNAVPGEGNPNAELVCVGEAPGANEDASGRPFVGAAGQLLTKILAAIKLSREEVFICNVLKHRPPGNRNPAPDEVEACSPYLLRQLELIRPKVILTVGTFAAQTLLATKTPIGKLRGRVHLYHGIPLVVTYHPAALLRNPAWKRPTWEDVQLARRILDNAPRA